MIQFPLPLCAPCSFLKRLSAVSIICNQGYYQPFPIRFSGTVQAWTSYSCSSSRRSILSYRCPLQWFWYFEFVSYSRLLVDLAASGHILSSETCSALRGDSSDGGQTGLEMGLNYERMESILPLLHICGAARSCSTITLSTNSATSASYIEDVRPESAIRWKVNLAFNLNVRASYLPGNKSSLFLLYLRKQKTRNKNLPTSYSLPWSQLPLCCASAPIWK